MDRRVDFAGEERGVDFLREQALAAALGERPVLDAVAACADRLERDALDLPALRLGQRRRASFACASARGDPRVPSVNRMEAVIAESRASTTGAFPEVPALSGRGARWRKE